MTGIKELPRASRAALQRPAGSVGLDKSEDHTSRAINQVLLTGRVLIAEPERSPSAIGTLRSDEVSQSANDRAPHSELLSG